MPSSSGASESGAARLLSPPITTLSSCSLPRIRSRTRARSASLQPPGSDCKHRRFALLKRSYKANQPERNSRLLVVRLIITLVRVSSLSVRTDLWGPLVASLLVEKTQRTLLDIYLQPRAVWSTGLFCGGSIIVEQSTGHHKRSRHTNNI